MHVAGRHRHSQEPGHPRCADNVSRDPDSSSLSNSCRVGLAGRRARIRRGIHDQGAGRAEAHVRINAPGWRRFQPSAGRPANGRWRRVRPSAPGQLLPWRPSAFMASLVPAAGKAKITARGNRGQSQKTGCEHKHLTSPKDLLSPMWRGFVSRLFANCFFLVSPAQLIVRSAPDKTGVRPWGQQDGPGTGAPRAVG